ncbi:MAG: TolC family protein [Candidatus Latescibacteria bacterium]|nr:TolC family protein [Candidatus Latescibacterota bacterium]
MKINQKLHCIFHAAGFAAFGFFILLFFTGNAESQYVLKLQDAIDIALEQSYNMKSLRLTLTQSEESYNASRFRFRTQVDMELDVPSWSERIDPVRAPNELPVYNRLGSKQFSSELNIRQPLPTDGYLGLRSTLYQTNEFTDLAASDSRIKGKTFYSSFGLVFNQPLFTYNTLKTGLKRTELSYERASHRLKRSQLDLVYNVTQSFFSLYRTTRTLEISAETLEQKKQVYDLAKLKFEAGLIPEVEALQMEVDFAAAQADYTSAEANRARQQDQFKLDIGLKLSDNVTVDTEISYESFAIDLEKALEEGKNRRTEIREQEIDIELQRLTVVETDARSEISADLNAFYDFTGVSDPYLPYETGTRNLFDSSWEDLKRRPRNRGVTLTFNIPIWDWGVNKAEVASARASLRNNELFMEEQQKIVENSIRDVVRSVEEARSRLGVLEKSQQVAQRSYDISMERFNNGEITSQDLALDNSRLTSAKMAYLSAFITYQLSIADLKRKTLWDFENNRAIE